MNYCELFNGKSWLGQAAGGSSHVTVQIPFSTFLRAESWEPGTLDGCTVDAVVKRARTSRVYTLISLCSVLGTGLRNTVSLKCTGNNANLCLLIKSRRTFFFVLFSRS
jgi:hypothetical protein